MKNSGVGSRRLTLRQDSESVIIIIGLDNAAPRVTSDPCSVKEYSCTWLDPTETIKKHSINAEYM